MRPDALRWPHARQPPEPNGRSGPGWPPGEKPARKRMATLSVVYDAEGPRRARPRSRRPRRAAQFPARAVRAAQVAVRFGDRRPRHRDRPGLRPHEPRPCSRPVLGRAGRRHPPPTRPHQGPGPPAVGAAVHVVIDFVRPGEAMGGCVICTPPPTRPPRTASYPGHPGTAVGQVHRVTADLKHHVSALPTTGEAASIPPSAASPTAAHLADHALAHGWPIATGVIEGACRHLNADRFNLAGARWGHRSRSDAQTPRPGRQRRPRPLLGLPPPRARTHP